MVRSVSAQLALLVFAVALLAGLHAGNSPTTILIRALVILFLTMIGTQLVGWVVKQVLREHLQRRKTSIDQAHIAAQRETRKAQIDEETPAAAPATGTAKA